MGDQSSNPSLQWLWPLLSHWKHMGPASSIEPYGTVHYFLVPEPWWDFPWGEAAYREHTGSWDPKLCVGSLDHWHGLCNLGPILLPLRTMELTFMLWLQHNPTELLCTVDGKLYKSSTTFIILIYISSKESIYYIEKVSSGLFLRKDETQEESYWRLPLSYK